MSLNPGWVAWLSMLVPGLVAAHGSVRNTPVLQVGASASISHYSAGAADSEGYWRIPGLVMGGEAMPIEQGWSLDDATLWAQYQLNDATRVHLAVGTHANEVDWHGIKLHNLFFDYEVPVAADINLTAGLLEAGFMAADGHHGGGFGNFTESDLLTDTFFGRHLSDKGIRADWQVNSHVNIGTEFLYGDLFPASSAEGLQDIYLKYRRNLNGWQLNSGVWAMQARAVKRGDERYFGGHSHAGSLAGTPADVRFSGDSTLSGAWFDLRSPRFGNGLYAGLKYNSGRTRSNGILEDESTRQVNYRNDYRAEIISPYLQYKQFRLALRHEKLALENGLQGAAAPLLAEEANLNNPAKPRRNSIQLQWQANSQWLLQATYTRDHTLPDAATDNRVSVGLVWQDTLYRR